MNLNRIFSFTCHMILISFISKRRLMKILANINCEKLFIQRTWFSGHKTSFRMGKCIFFSLLFWSVMSFLWKQSGVENMHVLCVLWGLENTTSVWISRQMRLFIGLWLHLIARVTMLPVLHGRDIIWLSCTTIGSSFSTPNDLCGLLCMCF